MVTVAWLTHPVGASSDVVGVTRSILMPLTVPLAALPARSLTLAVVERLAPSPVIVDAAGHVPSPSPDRSAWSAHVQLTTTSWLYQPSALGVDVGVPLIVGGVMSTSMFDTDAESVLPAASVAVPVTAWP